VIIEYIRTIYLIREPVTHTVCSFIFKFFIDK
jgi:hypothetical protein